MGLTLICGVPNAGKTTYSQRFKNVLHLDDIGTIKVFELVSTAGGDVIVEGYYGNPKERLKLLKAHGNHSKCIFLDITFDECIRRERRGRPTWMLKNAYKRFEPPTYSEGWDEIIIIGEQHG